MRSHDDYSLFYDINIPHYIAIKGRKTNTW